MWNFRRQRRHWLRGNRPATAAPGDRGVRVHTTTILEPADTTTRAGVPCTSFERTFCDSTGGHSFAQLGRVLDDGLRRGVTSIERVHSCRPTPRFGPATKADDRARSATTTAESDTTRAVATPSFACSRVLTGAGIPPPSSNTESRSNGRTYFARLRLRRRRALCRRTTNCEATVRRAQWRTTAIASPISPRSDGSRRSSRTPTPIADIVIRHREGARHLAERQRHPPQCLTEPRFDIVERNPRRTAHLMHERRALSASERAHLMYRSARRTRREPVVETGREAVGDRALPHVERRLATVGRDPRTRRGSRARRRARRAAPSLRSRPSRRLRRGRRR